MILDSSAILAILLREKGFEPLVEKLATAPAAGVGAPTLAEAGIVLTARIGPEAKAFLTTFLVETEIAVVPFGEVHWRTAVDAFQRYGKGRHRAGLNFGDCMTYATARLAEQPLLFTGGDFAQTDVLVA